MHKAYRIFKESLIILNLLLAAILMASAVFLGGVLMNGISKIGDSVPTAPAVDQPIPDELYQEYTP